MIEANIGVGRNKRFRHSLRYAGNATTRYALRQAQDRLGWSYSGLRLLLVIAVSPESSIKNLNIAYQQSWSFSTKNKIR